MSALVVNLFAGPGTGKSTIAALVFSKLKLAGVNAELAHEWAKEAAWEGRTTPLLYQPYVAGKQMWRVHRLLDETDVIVTDSPILFSLIYGEGTNLPSFEQFVWDTFNSWRTLNIFLDRSERAYNPKGRLQTEEEARALDGRIRSLLDGRVPHHALPATGQDTADAIAQMVLELL